MAKGIFLAYADLQFMDPCLKELPKALAAFQAEHHAAGRDSKGNYGAYTSLAGALAAIKNATAHGLSHSQTLHPLGEELILLRTSVFHISGELLCSDLPIPLKTEGRANYWQGLGSAITYARRYSLLAIYGLAGEDDEAETASAPAPAPAPALACAAKAKPAAANSMRNLHTPAQALQAEALEAPAPPAAEAVADICWLEKERHGRIVESLKSAPNKAEVLTAFKEHFKIATPKISPAQIQLQTHGDFLEEQLGLAVPSA